MNITNSKPIDDPLLIPYTSAIFFSYRIQFKCECYYKNNYTKLNVNIYSISNANQTFKVYSQNFIYSIKNVNYKSNSYLNLTGKTLKTGNYMATLEASYTTEKSIIYSDIKVHYFNVIPNKIIISGLASNNTTVTPYQPLFFAPMKYSYSPDGFTDFNFLNFTFYCKLYNSNSINSSMYLLDSKLNLSNYQSDDTCFKSKSIKFFI